MAKSAVLLLNLGSPDSTSVPDVKRYLHEFLGDERVIDKPDNAFLRSLLVRFIISRRAAASAHAYSTIWTAEGSPLIVTSQRTQAKLQSQLDLPVALAMTDQLRLWHPPSNAPPPPSQLRPHPSPGPGDLH